MGFCVYRDASAGLGVLASQTYLHGPGCLYTAFKDPITSRACLVDLAFQGQPLRVEDIRRIARGDADENQPHRGAERLPVLKRTCSQRTQYPSMKEYTLNHNVKAPII